MTSTPPPAMTPGERARKARENVVEALAHLPRGVYIDVAEKPEISFSGDGRGPGAWVTVRIWTPT